MRATARRLALTLALAAPGAGQPLVGVRLAADPAGIGPPALVWLRDHLRTEVPWPPGCAPRDAVCIDFAPGLRPAVRPAAPSGDDDRAYATVEVRFSGHALVGSCDWTGLEVLRGPWSATAAEPLAGLLSALHLAARVEPVSIDVSALVGNLAGAIDPTDPDGAWLPLAAAECGELVCRLQRAGGAFVVRGRSNGGLTLPAILVAAALRQAPPPGEIERWVRLGFTTTDDHREEAALHLARFPGARSRDTLARLLEAGDHTRVRAMESIVRHGDPAGLAAIVQAADPDVGDSVEMAEAALWSLFGRLDEGQRAALADALGSHPAPALRAFPSAWRAGDSPAPGHPPRAAPRGSGAPDDGVRRAVLAALLVACAVLGVRVARGLTAPA
jgi:hypothetical protein